MPDTDRAYVKSSSDPAQIRKADRRVLGKRARFLNAVRQSLTHPEVRIMLGELFDRVGLYTSTLEASGSLMYYAEGRRSIAQEMYQACCEADEAGTAEMLREHRAWATQQDRETDATHTRRATQQEGNV